MGQDKISDIENFRKKIKEDVRPWGKFRSFPYEFARNIKIITLNPGGVLSLQFHEHRSEFWVVLDEGLEVTLADRVWKPKEGEEISIPARLLTDCAASARKGGGFWSSGWAILMNQTSFASTINTAENRFNPSSTFKLSAEGLFPLLF